MNAIEFKRAQVRKLMESRQVLSFLSPSHSLHSRLQPGMASRVPSKSKIPKELVEVNQWVPWKYGPPNPKGKRSKIPINPAKGEYAAVNKPETWGSFEQAYNYCKKYKLAGVGFVLTSSDPYIGLDLDECIDPKTGKLSNLAQRLVEALDSQRPICYFTGNQYYTGRNDQSPSGRITDQGRSPRA